MKFGDLNSFQVSLGHNFADPDLLLGALTHPSFAARARGKSAHVYERLEFLGDRVLGLIIADMLDLHLPGAPEGDLSRRFGRLVSGETCAEVAREMELPKFLRISGGKATTSVLGDACESVLGAIYRDGGLAAAQRVVERYWRPRLETMIGPQRDAKTELQEWAHRRGFGTPAYLELLRSGPDHAPEFEIEVSVGTVAPVRAKGRSKKEAEHEAASILLRREGVWSAA